MLVIFIIVVKLCASADCEIDPKVVADRCIVESSGIILKLWPSKDLGDPIFKAFTCCWLTRIMRSPKQAHVAVPEARPVVLSLESQI
jgi:hypothetical protein